MTQPPGQQPGQPQSWQGGGFGPPPAAQGPYAPPRLRPYGAQQPSADNPYAQPGSQPNAQPGGQPNAQPYAEPGAQPYAHPNPQPPYGGYPPQFPTLGDGGPKPKRWLAVTAAVAALAVIGGGVWFAVGKGDDGESKKPAAKAGGTADAEPRPSGTPSAEESDGAGESDDPYADPDSGESEDEPGGGPTGTTLVGFWRSEKPGGGILGLRDSPDTTKPKKASVSLLDDGRCTGLRRVIEAGRSYRIGLLCERDKKEIYGNLVFSGGDTLTVTWDQGRTGKETYKRFLDWSEDGAGGGDAGSGGSGSGGSGTGGSGSGDPGSQGI
ncbi:hypothetical protein [Streptomyces flavofungini]|uniref:Serine/threonine protein kinase n=1 Tax=Streptomyces flavofungini TaxID=68200 RepID=A0ABS0XFN7_9ACTN|nr:hypothetical protein [Streptomyces flavofungini]MBJ3812042.1 hypothetical protein [Streptomyces flavofungini]GHC44638.1 hypothetical protein GCM10010349_06660 [Streptomyces flavofungini]